jgi:hypothetical protein
MTNCARGQTDLCWDDPGPRAGLVEYLRTGTEGCQSKLGTFSLRLTFNGQDHAPMAIELI